VRIEDKPVLDLADPNPEEADIISKWYLRPGGSGGLWSSQGSTEFASVYNEEGEIINDEMLKHGHLSGVVNAHALKTYLETVGAESPNFDLRKVLKNFKFGVRLSYVPPTSFDGFNISTLQEDFNGIFNNEELNFSEELYNNSVLEKTYWLNENGGTKNLHPIPLIKIEDSLGTDSLNGLTKTDMIGH